MLRNIPEEKLGHMPYKKFNDCPNLAESFLYPSKAAGMMGSKAKIAPSTARREVVYYCTVIILGSESQSYLAICGNKSVVG